MLQIIEDAKTWREIISKFPSFDYYHTWEYHQISRAECEIPVLIYYEQNKTAIALPLLKRSIPESDYFDLTSVYGYAGPLSRDLDSHFDNTTFKKELLIFMEKHKIVSVFSRLNPFIPFQDVVLKGIGEVTNLGPIVNIDLTKDLELQRRSYSKTTKRYVNRLRRICNIKKASSKEDIAKFIALYKSTMNRVDATDYYFFSEDYFNRFMESKEFQTDLIFAQLIDSGELICGAMMIKTNNIVQYHLSGTASEYLNITPLRLLIDETRIEATNEGYKYFNLGGGLGSQEDSLFYFKSSISKDFRNFSVWNYIVNEEVYKGLSNKKRSEIEKKDLFDESSFFPLYRIES
jgi:hypothetical protein